MSSSVEQTSGQKELERRKLPNPAICRAGPAKWSGTVFCLVRDPAGCAFARYFNEVAYCIHPDRESIIAKTTADENSGDSAQL